MFLIIKLASLFFIRASVNKFHYCLIGSNLLFNFWIFEIHCCALLEEKCEVFILIFWIFWIVVFNKSIEYDRSSISYFIIIKDDVTKLRNSEKENKCYHFYLNLIY